MIENMITWHSFNEVKQFRLHTIDNDCGTDCLTFGISMINNTYAKFILHTDNLAYVIYGFECIVNTANRNIKEYDSNIEAMSSEYDESDIYPATVSYSEFFEVTRVKFVGIDLDIFADKLFQFKIINKNGIETQLNLYTRDIITLVDSLKEMCKQVRDKIADRYTCEHDSPETVQHKSEATSIELDEEDWQSYPDMCEHEDNIVTFSKHFIVFPESLIERMGMDEWEYVQMSYNHNTHQICLNRNDGGIEISVHDDERWITTANFKEYFGITELTQKYTTHRIGDSVILTLAHATR